MVSPSSLSGPYRWQEYFAALTNLFQSGDITTRSDNSTAPADYGTLLTVSRDKRGKVLGWEARNRLISVKKGGALSITEYATASGKFFVVNSHRYNFKPGSPGLREFRIDYEGTGKPRHFNSDGQGGLPTKKRGKLTRSTGWGRLVPPGSPLGRECNHEEEV